MKSEKPAPVFDEKIAKAVPPTRHEPTGRTYCFTQSADLFSATGLFIATDAAAAAPAEKPAAKK